VQNEPKSAAEFIERFVNNNEGDEDRVPLEQAVQAEMATMNRHQRRAWVSKMSKEVGKARAKKFQQKAAHKP
jgi:predicted RNA-binding protein YlxR (DUF448 family)